MTSPGAVLVVAVLSHVVTQGQGFSSSDIMIACGIMNPGHGSPPQSSTSPYTLSVSASSYTAGQPVTVTLTGGSTQFKGFLLLARAADGGAMGSFTTTPGLTKSVRCGPMIGSGLTHVNATLKTSITTTWSTPTSVGNVTFKATVVQQFSTFWMDISKVLIDATLPLSTMPALPNVTTNYSTPSSSFGTTPASTTAATLGGNIDLTSCGVTKGCLQYPCPQGAGSGNCAVVTWQANKTSSSSRRRRKDMSSACAATPTVNFELYGLTSGWAAVGFSHDEKMGDDSVVNCVNDGTGRVMVQSSYNPAFIPLHNAPLSNPNLGLTNTWSQYVDGGVTCRFTRQAYNSSDSSFFDISQPFYLLLGFGPASGGVVGVHNYLPLISESKINVLTSLQSNTGTESAVNNCVKAHACLMVFAWVLLASVGILMARTLRTTLRGKTLLDSPLWLGIHRILLITAVVCTAVGFIVIFVYSAGLYLFPLGSPAVGQVHGALGIITMILAIINPIVVLARPKPGETGYKSIGLLHKIIGWMLHPTAAVTLVLGSVVLYDDESQVNSEYPVFWLLIAAIIVHLFAELAFAIDELCTSRKTSMRDEMAKEGEKAKVKVDNSNKGSTLRIAMFVVYVLIMIGLTVAILVLIGLM